MAEVLVRRRRAGRRRAARAAQRRTTLAPQLVEIHRLENEADRHRARRRRRRCSSNGIDPMMVIRWKDIFDTLESAVDACETVANVLEGITLKRANGRH